MKKKIFKQVKTVQDFINNQTKAIRLEFYSIVDMLEYDGRLSMPYGEKLSGKDLFAIRVIKSGNIRVFYVYGTGKDIFAIHAYEKKTRKIPKKELKKAEKALKLFKTGGLVK